MMTAACVEGLAAVDGLLQALAESVPGCTEVSVIVVRRGRASVVGATGSAAVAADAAQLESDSGPSLTAIRGGKPVVILPLLRAPGRFEEFKAAANEVGFGSCVSVPFRIEERALGAITFYAQATVPLDVSGIDDAAMGRLASALVEPISAAS